MTDLNPKDLTNELVRKTIQEIVKQYGTSIFPVPNTSPVPSIPTGAIALDEAIGVGGVPQGRIVVIAGEPGTAKSTLCMEIVKNAQHLYPDKLNLYVDMESGAYTDDYAYRMGINLDPNLFLPIKPDYAEQGMVIIYNLIATGRVAVCVWDSIAGATATKENAANTAEDNNSIASVARMLSNQLPKLANKCGKTGTTLMLVNQVRTQFGGHGITWNDISGGRAQKYYSSVRIDLAKEKEKDFTGAVDRETITARVSRNKVAIPYRMANFDVRLGFGILRESNVLDVATKKGIPQVVSKGAGYYFFYDFETGAELASPRGRNKAVDYLVDNPEYRAQVEQAILGFQRKADFESELEDTEPDTITEEDITHEEESKAFAKEYVEGFKADVELAKLSCAANPAGEMYQMA
jgi:recombination protein RecA